MLHVQGVKVEVNCDTCGAWAITVIPAKGNLELFSLSEGKS